MNFGTYRAMTSGFSFALLFLEICVFISISNRLSAELIGKLFGIIQSDDQTFMMNFYGVQIDFLSSRRFRLSLIFQLSLVAWIISLLFIEGWIMKVQHLSGEDLCPLLDSACFITQKFSSHEQIVCEPGQALSNNTSLNVVCYVWVYSKLSAVDIMNRVGICSSVFSFLCHAFKCSCRMSRKWWGLVLLTLFVVSIITVLIVSFIIEIQISVTGKLLLTGLSSILMNVIQLFQFTQYRRKRKTLLPTKEQLYIH
jgi:hypothetical protein